jgi:hypothetical protein
VNFGLGHLRHPSFDAIEGFAFGEEARTHRAPIARHLRECAGCQERVRALRALRGGLLTHGVPPMSHDLRARIISRSRQGERAIIPIGPSNTSLPARLAPRWAISTVTAALIIVAVLLVPRQALDAGGTAGTLTISQASVAPPTVHVRYLPAGKLARATRVTLRVTAYGPGGPFAPIERHLDLARERDHGFVGDVKLPAGTVFARYLLTSRNGDLLDDNDGRGWEGAMRDSASRPLFDGLQMQMVLDFDRWERAAQAAHDMARFYPERPASHRYALSSDLELAGAASEDSVISVYRPVVDHLHSHFASARITPAEMWELAMLGMQMHDSGMVAHWRRRLTAEFPTDPATAQQRVFAIEEAALPPDQTLREMERIWGETRGQSVQLLYDAFGIASRTNDSLAVARWGERLAAFGGGYERLTATKFASMPALRARGEVLLRASLRARPPVPADEWRTALRRNARAQRTVEGQWQLESLGRALLEDSSVNAARDTLRRAASLEWSAPTMRLLGDAELAGGDTTAAMIAYAWSAADPRTATALSDSLQARLGSAHLRPWNATRAEGRALLRAITMQGSMRRAFEARATFTFPDGRRRALADVLKSRVAVVAFVSRTCAPSLSDLASLDSAAQRLGGEGIPMVTLVEETARSNVASILARHGFRQPLGYDDRAEVSRTMRQAGTPHYFVVENGRMIRFDARKATDLTLLVDALQGSSGD